MSVWQMSEEDEQKGNYIQVLLRSLCLNTFLGWSVASYHNVLHICLCM